MFSQLSIFTADCLCHTVQMAGVESIWYSYCNELLSITKARFPTMHILFDRLLPAQVYPCVVVILYCSDEVHIYIKAKMCNIHPEKVKVNTPGMAAPTTIYD